MVANPRQAYLRNCGVQQRPKHALSPIVNEARAPARVYSAQNRCLRACLGRVSVQRRAHGAPDAFDDTARVPAP
jgi:hypothetical protein